MIFKNGKDGGFTIIEMSIIASVIIILTATLALSLNSFTKNGRDTKRLQDISAIRTALEIYYRENNHYPVYESSSFDWDKKLIKDLEDYLPVMPTDPVNDGSSISNRYGYYYKSTESSCDGSWYILTAKFESKDFVLKDPPIINQCGLKYVPNYNIENLYVIGEPLF